MDQPERDERGRNQEAQGGNGYSVSGLAPVVLIGGNPPPETDDCRNRQSDEDADEQEMHRLSFPYERDGSDDLTEVPEQHRPLVAFLSDVHEQVELIRADYAKDALAFAVLTDLMKRIEGAAALVLAAKS